MKQSILKHLLVLATLAAITECGQFRFKGLECQSVDKTFCVVELCDMKPLSRGVKEINAVFRLLKVPVSNITIYAEIRQRGYLNLPVFTFNIDACRFLETKNRNPIANAIYKFLHTELYSNMNHTCPYDHDIIVDHCRIDDTIRLQLPIGLGDYVLKTNWHAYDELRARFNINFEVID